MLRRGEGDLRGLDIGDHAPDDRGRHDHCQHRRGRPVTCPGQEQYDRRRRERRPDRRDSEPGPRLSTSLPSSAASAEKLTTSSPAREANRRTHPRAVVNDTPAASAAGRTPRSPPAARVITRPGVLGRVQWPGQHERGQQRMGHPAALAPGLPDEHLPAPPGPVRPENLVPSSDQHR